MRKTGKVCKCKLCGLEYDETEMSDEHYPARSTGNEDIVQLDLIKMIDSLQSYDLQLEIDRRLACGEKFDDISGSIFDERLSMSLHPDGRTARTLCKKCNTFIGKYDEAYLRFFKANGDPKVIKGFQAKTKYQIIKAIYAKFLSLPETVNEEFDFIDFIKNEGVTTYNGVWRLFFVKRDLSSDILGLQDIDTGKAEYDEGVVYELSDSKFIFNLMNFPKHACYPMTNIFDILHKQYDLVEGVGEHGGYHAMINMEKWFSETDFIN